MSGENNRLYISNESISPRLFESDFLEFFTYFHFSTPLVIFTPVLCYQAYEILYVDRIPYLIAMFGALVGLLVWSFVEYMAHRFLFHAEPEGKGWGRIVFLFHGVHHNYPRDPKRLIMTPFVSIPLAIASFYLLDWAIGAPYASPIFCGLFLGYVVYDISHYMIHHGNSKNPILTKLRRYHLKHHFSQPHRGFGVTTPLWDYIFRTHFAK